MAKPADKAKEVKIFDMTIVIPRQVTMDKYGYDEALYLEKLEKQNYKCPICGKTPSTGKFVIDHEHVKNYKKLPPELRRKHVRGILCYFCNRFYMAKAMTTEKAKNVIEYLGRYQARLTE